MTRDLHDDAISQLVRDTAAGWTMPPVRLDAPSWRERVRQPRARRIAAARGAFGRLGRAATAAVALTVGGALVAVVLTRPPIGPGKSPAASSGESPGQTTGPSGLAGATPLPQLLIEGDPPDPSVVLVQVDGGDYAQVDLAAGTVGATLSGARYGSAFRRLADGSLVCLCLAESGRVGGKPTTAAVSLQRYDADGTLVSGTPIESFTGAADTRDATIFVPEQPAHVLTAMSFSDDGRYGFVGWSRRAAPAWQSGVLVVNLADGSVASRLDLPDTGTGDGDARRVTDAPRVVGAAPFLRLLVARAWYGWRPVASQDATYTLGTDVFAAGFSGGQLSGAAPIEGATGCGETVTRGGTTPDGGLWFSCAKGASFGTTVRRLAPDGTFAGDTSFSGAIGVDGDMTAVSPDGRQLFGWNPLSATLTRVDLATGEAATGQAAAQAAAEPGPLWALGAWLAPTTAAKSFLQGAIAVSPDGTRVYALGIVPGSVSDREPGGSEGVLVFDASSLSSLGRWTATADFVSLAVSGDGRFVYAAGMPGVDAAGNAAAQGASITVFDVASGSVRLLNGQLGARMLLFPGIAID